MSHQTYRNNLQLYVVILQIFNTTLHIQDLKMHQIKSISLWIQIEDNDWELRESLKTDIFISFTRAKNKTIPTINELGTVSLRIFPVLVVNLIFFCVSLVNINCTTSPTFLVSARLIEAENSDTSSESQSKGS